MAKKKEDEAAQPLPLILELTIANPKPNQWPTPQFHDKEHLMDWLTHKDYGQCPGAQVKGKKVVFNDENDEEVVFGTIKDI